ncbi:hypothetical protein DVR12_05665 [Chitinophaga silvatica]|uniref:Signal transduction histidine kinase internal region domain-containing protein n=1 Tax=Chitinophaga silvatica TaxID=2282649 RepID=A0A3E1YDU9_9BACT|nr:sensor histidine kinase [Chitinophaga silvatica]RFS24688.1 hypothetical protein DVR12_05665 [Chitinophaga silvatica]
MTGILSNTAELDESRVKKKLASWVSFFMSDRYYKTNARLWTHIIMWVGLAVMNFIMFYSGFMVSLPVAFSILARNIFGSMFAFYTVFYFTIPKLLLKGHWFLAFIGFCLPFVFWAVLNYLSATYTMSHFEVSDLGTRQLMQRVVDGGWAQTLSISNLLRLFIPVIIAIGPVMILKLVLDIIRGTTRQLRLERDNLDLEVNFLRSQLNPHFLFNTLNNIYSLSIRNDALASDLIMHLSEMMRYTLYDSNTDKVPLQMEAEFLKNYIELESVRYGKNASITFNYDPDQMTDLTIPPLLMFPFVENAFKYSHSTNSAECWVNAKIEVTDKLRFEIANSKGQGPEQKQGVGGIGLVNTRKRLLLLYPGKHDLQIENKSDSYKVVLTITLS